MLTTPETTELPAEKIVESSEAHSASPPLEWHDEPFPILLLLPEALKGGPHIGNSYRITWYQLAALLWWQRSKEGDAALASNDAKAARGGWVGGRYRGNHRKVSKFVETRLLVIDVDRGGSLEKVSRCFASYVFIAHTTYKSTSAAPRCRVVLLLDRPCTDARQYKAAHKAVVDMMMRWGYVEGDVDRGASDVSRLNYLPMHQSGVKPKTLLGNGGETRINIEQLLAAVPATAKRDTPRAPTSNPKGDAYWQAALKKAAERVRAAPDGNRNNTLNAEAFGLARPESTLAMCSTGSCGSFAPEPRGPTCRGGIRHRRPVMIASRSGSTRACWTGS